MGNPTPSVEKIQRSIRGSLRMVPEAAPDFPVSFSRQGSWLQSIPPLGWRQMGSCVADRIAPFPSRSAWLDAWILGDEWAKAREMATRLTAEFPDEPGFCLHLAYATRRAEGGGMEQALKVLDGALEKFPKEWMIPYNMACYLCQLERLDEAKSRLDKALEIGGTGIRTAALGDEDLLPLWPWIKKRDQ
mgnify:CR=1 FL=1